jgi:hypothetical protein
MRISVTARRLSGLVAALCTAAVVAHAQQSPDQVIVPLSDPARPAILNVQAVEGGMTVRGADRRDVLVITHERAPHRRNQRGGGSGGGAGTGLRQLDRPPALTIEEANNRISLTVQSTDRVIDFEIQVPRRSDLKLATANNGEIVVEGVEGELEISNPNGAITLNSVGGSIVANSVNGNVKATVTSLSTQKPMAFTSLNGHVDVTFPASMKATLKLRSDEGQVLTDFDVAPLQRPTTAVDTRREGDRLRIERNRTIYGAVNGGGPEIELRTFHGNVYVRRAQ